MSLGGSAFWLAQIPARSQGEGSSQLGQLFSSYEGRAILDQGQRLAQLPYWRLPCDFWEP